MNSDKNYTYSSIYSTPNTIGYTVPEESYYSLSNPYPIPNYITQTTDLTITDNEKRLNKFNSIIMKHEINQENAIKLRQLEGFEIVIICDDSSSMNTLVSNPSIKDHQNMITRWQELKNAVKIIIELAGTLDRTGVDVYFLNREKITDIKDYNAIELSFMTEPSGYTPIVEVFNQVLIDAQPKLSEKKLLIILATDGEPTTRTGHLFSYGIEEKTKFINLLKSRQPIEKIYTTILACTDDDNVMSYLSKLDNTIKNLDIVDDYYTVKQNVIKKYGSNYSFTFGDYILKIMLGSIDIFFDEIDEVPSDVKCAIL